MGAVIVEVVSAFMVAGDELVDTAAASRFGWSGTGSIISLDEGDTAVAFSGLSSGTSVWASASVDKYLLNYFNPTTMSKYR